MEARGEFRAIFVLFLPRTLLYTSTYRDLQRPHREVEGRGEQCLSRESAPPRRAVHADHLCLRVSVQNQTL